MRTPSIAMLIAIAQIPAMAALPEEYEVTDITGWSAEQLENLPHFDRYIPGGKRGDYSPIARSGFGTTVGNRDFTNGGWVQGSGAYLENGVVTSISAWLRPGYWWSYSWSRTWWDGDDYHFENGFRTHSPARDINALGQVVGYATVPGSGDSGIGYRDHAYLHDTISGEHVDLTPDADRADPRSINDLSEIVGTWWNGDGSHAFRRNASAPAGFTDFVLTAAPSSYSLTPNVLNNRGQAAGSAIVYTVPERDRRPFFSESGSATERLPLPRQNSPDAGDITGINEHGILVGIAYKAASSYETNGVRWARVGGGWQVDDLNELLADHEPEMIIDRAIAINDAGHIIASAHPDGTEVPSTRTVLLSPDRPARPAVSTLRPEVGTTGATLYAKINAAGAPTRYQFQLGDAAPDGGGVADGTAPVMAAQTLSGLLPNTTYSFRATATNPAGTTIGLVQTFTTQWDWPSWSAARGMPDPSGDADHNGQPDLIDFATGASAPAAVVAGGEIKFRYRRSLQAGGVELNVEVSDDLLTWGDATISSMTRAPDGVGGEFITVCVDAGAARRFTRLTARLP